MNVCIDENIPRMTLDALRAAGHDVLDIRGTPDEGMEDAALWSLAQSQKRLLVSTDKGFALRRHEAHFGILLILLRQPNRRKIHQRVLTALEETPQADWPGLLVVMRDTVRSVWRKDDDKK